MPNKKDDQKPTSDDSVLEHRVDAMMDPKLPEPTPPTPDAPLDIFADQNPAAEAGASDTPSTAPKVPANLLKQIGGHKTKPLTESKVSSEVGSPAPSTKITAPATTPKPVATDVQSDLPGDDPLPDPKLDDATTDAAVDDIVSSEADTLLAVQDSAADAAAPPSKKSRSSDSFKNKLKAVLKSKWTWLIVLVALLLVAALPVTRYKLAGLLIKKPLGVTILDSLSGTPVSNSQIAIDGKQVKTDGEGRANLSVSVGDSQLQVSKQYYKNYQQKVFVGFKGSQPLRIHLVATGRQVPLVVVNKITGKPLAGASIRVLNTSAKTDSHGKAIIVLPTSATSDNATVSLSGYNSFSTHVQVTASVVAANTLTLTPTGRVYFLSNQSGTIDVDSANLDGSARKTVLSGTGKEDPNNTELLASGDWHYLVLEAQRDSSQPALYLITTSSGKLTEFDSGAAGYTLIGWQNDTFVYDAIKDSVQTSQAGHELLKSYDAAGAKLNQLDQDQVDGTSTDYAYQSFANFALVGADQVVYTTQWYMNGNADLSSKSDTIRGVNSNGQNKKDYQSVAASGVGFIQAAVVKPQVVDYAVNNFADNKTAYYQFANGSVSTSSAVSAATFNKTYPDYVLSASGNRSLWNELRDGQNVLFTGDENAANPQQIANANGYQAYSWYGENYVLVSKSSSQLFILPADGSHTPLKLTDYYSSNGHQGD